MKFHHIVAAGALAALVAMAQGRGQQQQQRQPGQAGGRASGKVKFVADRRLKKNSPLPITKRASAGRRSVTPRPPRRM